MEGAAKSLMRFCGVLILSVEVAFAAPPQNVWQVLVRCLIFSDGMISQSCLMVKSPGKSRRRLKERGVVIARC